MHPVTDVLSYILAHETLLYPILAVIIMIQAEIGILVSLYLIRLDHAAWSIFIIIGLLSVFVEEIALFFAGSLIRKTGFGEKIVRKVPWNEKIHAFLHGNTYTSLLLAKSMWISRLVVFWMGHTGMSFKKFLKAVIPTILIWFFVLTSIVYGLISIFGIADNNTILKRVEIVLPSTLLVMFLIQLLLRKLIKIIFKKSPEDNLTDH